MIHHTYVNSIYPHDWRFHLKILPQVIGGSGVGSNISYVAVISDVKDREPLQFRVTTYDYLRNPKRKGGVEYWDATFRIANDFLSTLPLKDQHALHDFYNDSLSLMNAIQMDTIQATIDSLQQRTRQLIDDTNITHKAMVFIKNNRQIVYPDLSSIGQRPIDSDNMTFGLHDYVKLTALCLVSKLMCPIHGEYIHKTSKEDDIINSKGKEIHGLHIVEPINEAPDFVDITDKLENYSNQITSKAIEDVKSFSSSKDHEFSMAINGFTVDHIHVLTFSTIVVKRLVYYNPYSTEPNAGDIMKYLMSHITETARNLTSGGSGKQSSVMVRKDANGNDHSDEGNTSEVEFRSISSSTPPHLPVIYECEAAKMIPVLLKKFNLPFNVYKDAATYYSQRLPTTSTPLNPLFVGLTVGKFVGGTEALKYIKNKELIGLITLTQMKLIRDGRPMLAELLTSKSARSMMLENITPSDIRIKQSYQFSTSYQKCVAMYPYVVCGERLIEKQIKSIVDWIVDSDIFYNTAPAISDFAELPQREMGTQFDYDDTVISQICTFITDHVDLEE